MAMSPYLKRQQKKSSDSGAAGKLSEKRVAKRIGGRLRPASGALDAKGDIDLPDVLMEAKSTVGASISLKHEWLSKISAEAEGVNKQPAVALTFTDSNGRPVREGSWVAIPERLFKELFDGF